MQPGVHILTGGDGHRYSFDPGAFCLEMLLTGGPGRYRHWEILDRPGTLAEWAIGTRLALDGPLTTADLHITTADVTKIRHLRDTLWTIAGTIASGEAPAPPDLEVINRYAESPPRPRLDPATGERAWVTPITGRQILGALARDTIAVLTSAGRIRQCAASDCYLLFLDTSRPGNRRWCSMERCGNRNKVRAHRART